MSQPGPSRRDRESRFTPADESLTLNTITVHESEEPEYTGLLDRHGRRLYRKKFRMGFQ